jgi:hypothetical protein
MTGYNRQEMKNEEAYKDASSKTAINLRTIAHSIFVRDASKLSLPEIDSVVDRFSRIVPAGNVPALILNGLARLPGRRPPPRTVERDVNRLFQGVESALDKAIYSTFFAGPAAIIWGYQQLLKLAGKEMEDAFPEGVWQFYVNYALREDTARHANETHGFDTVMRYHNIQLNQRDRLCAWTMAAIQCLHQYPQWLANEWRERVYTFILQDVTRGTAYSGRFDHLYWDWQKEKPYGLEPDLGSTYKCVQNYAAYRRLKFDQFLAEAMADLDNECRQRWIAGIQSKGSDLIDYQRQMTIQTYLDPGPYGESRLVFPISNAHIGIIYNGQYYLIPACQPDSSKPAEVEVVRSQIGELLFQRTAENVTSLEMFAGTKRTSLRKLKEGLGENLQESIRQLHQAPILINADQRPDNLPLSEIRQGERGIGDHALTVFDTGRTFVFDQSHIFFDGAWGAGLAEILTREAIAWGVLLHRQPSARKICPSIKPIQFSISDREMALIEEAPKITYGVSAETDAVRLKPILTLRKLFKRRSDLLNLTVNDLLVLYRVIHAFTYRLDPALGAELEQLTMDREGEMVVREALEAIELNQRISPAILIPIDATLKSPKERVYPMVFEVPVHEIDLLGLHQQTLKALEEYENGNDDQSEAHALFDSLQREYLATLASLAAVLTRAKEVGVHGESASVETIKLLAHIPTPVQRLLDRIPNRFDVLNDLIKGREIFSNIGRVVPSSSLTRFATAKDDNEKKDLVWGVVTDADGVMRITLRDFRSHVGPLRRMGRKVLAEKMAQDYLDKYAIGLNEYVDQVLQITSKSRETRRSR